MRIAGHDRIRCSLGIGLALLAAPSACRRPGPLELRPSVGALAARALQGMALQASNAGAKAAPSADGPAGAPSDAAVAPAGYVRVEVVAQLGIDQGNALLLVELPDKKRFVPIFVGGTEALSIRLRLDGEKYARPLTHDLLDALLRRLGAKLEQVQVDDLRDNIYVGTVVVTDRDGKRLELDARPSDAVALAVGNRAPIFMALKVLDRAGHPIDGEIDPGKAERPADATRL